MKIIILAYAFVMLIINLKRLRNIFKSSESINNNFNELFSKHEDNKDVIKTLLIAMGFIFTIFSIAFYIFSGSILGLTITTLFATIMVLYNVVGFFKLMSQTTKEKFRAGIIGRILLPLATVYIIYFIVKFLGM